MTVSVEPVLDVRGVSRRYRDRMVVDSAHLRLDPGRISCLLGPSGCGKSTLLRLIAGLEPVDEGSIAIHGTVMSTPASLVSPERRGVGLVFQDNALFPHLTVADNVAFGLRGMAKGARQATAAALLARFHVEHLAQAWPHMLSGGEQQRVAIARALAREPSLLLLDEPFSGLDGHLRMRVRRSLIGDLRASGATVLIVTHDPEEAMLLADELILMADGRILQAGSPEVCFRDPVSIAAARLLGDIIVFPASVRDEVADTPLGPVAARGVADGPAEAYVRREMLRIGASGAHAQVTQLRFAGAAWAVDLDLGGFAITIHLVGDPPQPGDQVLIDADRDAIRVEA